MTMKERNRNHSVRMCIMCANQFTSLATLKVHIRVNHAGVQKCSLCEVIVQTKRNLVRHLQKHKGEKMNRTNTKLLAESSSFLCDQCNYTCNVNAQLNRHISRVHGDERPFVCLYMNCNKSYVKRGDLNAHENYSHVKLKKVKCNMCAMKFINTGILSKHVDQLHTLVGRHHCALCQKNYREKQALELHNEAVHKKISLACSQCGKGFSWQGNLTRHRKDVHQKEKSHICSFCGKTFSQNSSLKGHKQSVHTGEQVAETAMASKHFYGWTTDEVFKCHEIPSKLQLFLQSEESDLANIMLPNKNFVNSVTESEVDCENKKQVLELNVMEISEVFESTDTIRSKDILPDSDFAKRSSAKIYPVKEGCKDVRQAKTNFETTEQKLNMLNISVVVESTDTGKIENHQLHSASCSDTAKSSHEEGCVDAEQPKVNLERKLNDILLSEDGWLAEMYLAAQNRVLSPITVPEHREIARVLSLQKDTENRDIARSAQNSVSLACKTVKQEKITTPKTEYLAEYRKMSDKILVSTFQQDAQLDAQEVADHNINVENKNLFEPVPRYENKPMREHEGDSSHNISGKCVGGRYVILGEHEITNNFEKCPVKKEDIRKCEFRPTGRFCVTCSKNYKTEERFKIHNSEKHGIRKLRTPIKPCDVCNKEFKSRANLERHRVIHYDDRERFPCNQCSKTMVSVDHLRLHHRNVHLGLQPKNFSCPSCPLRQTSRASLDLHILRRHGEAGTFDCDMCESIFKAADYLETHKKKIHNGQRQYKYSCTTCNKHFYEKSKFDSHQEAKHIQSGKFKCSYCSVCWGTQYSLDQHFKIHFQIKDFVCTHCGKAFIQKSTLVIHMRTVHYKMKPYNCDKCGKTFGQSGDMKRHIKIHHNS